MDDIKNLETEPSKTRTTLNWTLYAMWFLCRKFKLLFSFSKVYCLNIMWWKFFRAKRRRICKSHFPWKCLCVSVHFASTAFWAYIREILSRHDLQRYSMLKTIWTDAGRGRAWLRSTLNEHSLEKYMHMVVEKADLLRCHTYSVPQ